MECDWTWGERRGLRDARREAARVPADGAGGAYAAGAQPARRRSRRTLGLLAGIWLLGGVDLAMSVFAARRGLLTADDECNPLAALVLPWGLGALVLYKTLLSAGGSVALVRYRSRRIAEWAAAAVLFLYAGVSWHWMLLYGLYVPLRHVSLRLGGFCHSAGQLGYAMLLLGGATLSVAAAHARLRWRDDRIGSRRRGQACLGSAAVGCRAVRALPPFGVRVALEMVLVLVLIPLSCSPARSPLTRTDTLPTGAIYYRDWWDPAGRLWSINADGSDPRALPAGVRGEPGLRPHGGHRWFLTVREIPGATYPDGRPRNELFAVRDDAWSVQLTDQADLEPAPFALRWLPHAADDAISWVARRWDSGGRVADGGLYTARLAFACDGGVSALAEPPRTPVIRFALVQAPGPESWWQAPAPDVRDHDWSPDGASVVYETTQNTLRIADLVTGRTTQVTDTPASHPVWSPDGTRVAFKIFRPLGGIATIRPTGIEERTLVEYRAGAVCSVAEPIWSPDGRHLLYRRVSFSYPLEVAAEINLWLAAADGTSLTNVTAAVGGYVTPIAWR
jgi:hypothetical protein